ncbi:PEGA domain-containing protein [Treponema brennaborense]|uniref:PEGA domain-containing protein n=1 Tax=Treponema brennaborense (strain DSM 12168 / CIP 105900 / DD5/3) TaxID=906968 RepID=F4LL23_TREBD|nr:PEGA domain-containing protein [Treponema brennaborense]AEE17597.1 hypothetical protein Trebr_2185 [Treponema brennaborense DSM 12168]
MKSKVFVSVAAVVTAVLLGTGCVSGTNVRFVSDVPGAQVYVDGELVGTTPTAVKLSNAVWESPDVLIVKEGYKDTYTELKKEVKPVNLVCGLLLWWPSLLYVYGPKQNQSYVLTPSAQ